MNDLSIFGTPITFMGLHNTPRFCEHDTVISANVGTYSPLLHLKKGSVFQHVDLGVIEVREMGGPSYRVTWKRRD